MRVEEIRVAAYAVPTDLPESDGTFAWESTTIVIVQARCEACVGIGYTYADTGTAVLIRDQLAARVVGLSPMEIAAASWVMTKALRNLGWSGPSAMAISAVDNALWDLKAKLLNLPLVTLLGAVREALPLYGSGGFTSYSDEELQRELAAWHEEGFGRMKIKVGREPERDSHRVRLARRVAGDEAQLFVDANSAYSRKQALYYMEHFSQEYDVRWMEQPLLPEDRVGMRWLREHGPARMEVADGEYGYTLSYFRDMIEAGAVDAVMADATRCCGITGFLKIAALCEAYALPLSSHCAPTLHLHPGCALLPMVHAEFFHDHARIERLFFDGFAEPVRGEMRPDLSAPGFGIALKEAAAEPYRLVL